MSSHSYNASKIFHSHSISIHHSLVIYSTLAKPLTYSFPFFKLYIFILLTKIHYLFIFIYNIHSYIFSSFQYIQFIYFHYILYLISNLIEIFTFLFNISSRKHSHPSFNASLCSSSIRLLSHRFMTKW